MIIEGGFKADSIIIDGFDFSRTNKQNIEAVKNFAVELGISVWYSCSIDGENHQYDKDNIPEVLNGFIGHVDIVLVLQPKHDHVEFSILKDRGSAISKPTAMKLDTKTLLILEA